MTEGQDYQTTSLTEDGNEEEDEVKIDKVPHFLVGKPLEDHNAKDSDVSIKA